MNKINFKYNREGRKLIFSNYIPDNFGGTVIDYFHFIESKERHYINFDIRNIIVLNQNKWLKDLEIWHKDLSDLLYSASYLWPLFHGSRLVFWKTISKFEFKPLFFSAALIELLKSETTDELIIKNCPNEVIDIFKNITLGSRIKMVNSILALIKAEVIFYKSLSKNLIKCIRHINLRKTGMQIGQFSTVVFTDKVSNNFLKNSDHFFGNIDNEIKKKIITIY
jgi:hypothetical protein